jgi:hypothetical protein
MCWRVQGLDDHIVAFEVRAGAASSHIQVVVRRDTVIMMIGW